MFGNILKSIFGSHNDRVVKKYMRIADEVDALEPEMIALTDEQLRGKTEEFRRRLADGETLDDFVSEAFAVAREGAKRAIGLRPFRVQIVGALALHKGMIAEMKTGEGKTLVATLAVYLNALEGKGVHVVTVNDYLAKRDAEWMGRIYRFLGLTVGTIVHDLSDEQRREQYNCDITYATNNELGFDYLRDNMKFYASELVMRPFNYALVDEVDSILIDEARTPLIISGAAEDSADLYMRVDAVIPNLVKEDYEIDEKHRTITLTEAGNEHIEKLLAEAGLIQGTNLYDLQNIAAVHHVNNALKAHHLFKRDVDYIVKNNKVIIIDEFTGRMMEGRRYSDGLHQALEAKEHVKIEMENQTLASITFQNFFRMYKKLAGMTGTAATEAQELSEIYKLETLVIPTNKPVARKDYDDEVYRTAREKYDAIIQLIRECHSRQQPVLVGTVSIEKSELLSDLLKRAGIEHNVLNARYHDIEAQIIAEAGKPGAVTIATNMAGRGTDIKLGGNLENRLASALEGVEDPEVREQIEARVKNAMAVDEEIVKKAGGLYVIGTERHESRRIDNQLRGRSGRQGDPGASKFFLSLEDDLMRIFGAEKLNSTLQKLGIQEGEAITHPWVNKALEKAQMRVEARNYDIRKHLLKFDDVMNDQRKVIYEQRHKLMDEKIDLSGQMKDMRAEVARNIIFNSVTEGTPSYYWDYQLINDALATYFGDVSLEKNENMSREDAVEIILEQAETNMARKETLYTSDVVRYVERTVLLRLIDQYWKEHLVNLDRLRQGINLRAYGQRDPLNEYKREAFLLFENMSAAIREEAVKMVCKFEMSQERRDMYSEDQMEEVFDDIDDAVLESEDEMVPQGNALPRPEADGADAPFSGSPFAVPRNAPCPCGSGKKYKFCCGRIGAQAEQQKQAGTADIEQLKELLEKLRESYEKTKSLAGEDGADTAGPAQKEITEEVPEEDINEAAEPVWHAAESSIEEVIESDFEEVKPVQETLPLEEHVKEAEEIVNNNPAGNDVNWQPAEEHAEEISEPIQSETAEKPKIRRTAKKSSEEKTEKSEKRQRAPRTKKAENDEDRRKRSIRRSERTERHAEHEERTGRDDRKEAEHRGQRRTERAAAGRRTSSKSSAIAEHKVIRGAARRKNDGPQRPDSSRKLSAPNRSNASNKAGAPRRTAEARGSGTSRKMSAPRRASTPRKTEGKTPRVKK